MDFQLVDHFDMNCEDVFLSADGGDLGGKNVKYSRVYSAVYIQCSVRSTVCVYRSRTGVCRLP